MVFRNGYFDQTHIESVKENVLTTGKITFNIPYLESDIIKIWNKTLYNYIFERDDKGFTPITTSPNFYTKLKINGEIGTKRLDYELLGRYYTYKLYTKVKPKDITFPEAHNMIKTVLPFFHFKLTQQPIEEYTSLVESITEIDVSERVKAFNKFLTNAGIMASKTFDIKERTTLSKVISIPGIQTVLKKNYITLPYLRDRLTIPKYNMTTMWYLANTYSFKDMVFLKNNNTTKILIPQLIDTLIGFQKKEMKLIFAGEREKPLDAVLEYLHNLLVENDGHKFYYNTTIDSEKAVVIDAGDIVMGYTRIGAEKGVYMFEKIITKNSLYLRLLKDYTSVHSYDPLDIKTTELTPQEFLNLNSQQNFLYIDTENSLIKLITYKDDEAYYTKIALREGEAGIKDGYLLIPKLGMKIKIFNITGYTITPNTAPNSA